MRINRLLPVRIGVLVLVMGSVALMGGTAGAAFPKGVAGQRVAPGLLVGSTSTAASASETTATRGIAAHIDSLARVPSPASVTSTGADSVPNAPLENEADHLSNWAGYVAQGSSGEFVSVSADWTIPTVTCPASDAVFGTWVGLDGSGDDTVEQTGDRTVCGATSGTPCATDTSDTPCEFAWYEMYPSSLVSYDEPISAGDTMMASVSYSVTTFTLTISDTTQGWTETAPPQSLSTAKRKTCEAIVESHSDPIPAFEALNFTDVLCNGEPLQTFNPGYTCTEGSGTIIYCPGPIQNQEDFSITPPLPLSITTTSLPSASVGVGYSAQLQATGGVSPYRWKVSGHLPKGLKLDHTTGLISGTPTAKAVTENFTVQVTDKSHPKQSATAMFTITVG